MFRLLLTPGGVHGTVRSVEGLPLPGVRVEADGLPRTTTDSLGRYAVTPLGVGSHELRFVTSGYAPRTISVLLGDASDIAIDIELLPSVVVLPTISVTA